MTVYNRKGDPISASEWEQRSMDRTYVVVATDAIGPVTVHTIWCGADALTNIATVIIEHGAGESQHGPVEAYANETEALAGHARWVQKYSQGR